MLCSIKRCNDIASSLSGFSHTTISYDALIINVSQEHQQANQATTNKGDDLDTAKYHPHPARLPDSNSFILYYACLLRIKIKEPRAQPQYIIQFH